MMEPVLATQDTPEQTVIFELAPMTALDMVIVSMDRATVALDGLLTIVP